MTQQDQTPASEPAGPFLRLARQVERRLFLRSWVAALHRTSVPLFGLLLLSLLGAWVGGVADLPLIGRHVLPAAVGLALVWLAAGALYARLLCPRHATALAMFDACNGGEEIFVSAYHFAGDQQRSAGAELHIERAQAALGSAAAAMGVVLPVRVPAAAVYAPIAFLLLATFGLPALAAAPAVADASAEAALVGESLDREARSLDDLDAGLTDEEKEKLEGLKRRLEDSAQKLSDPNREKSARDVLEELERRATQAEALAAMLGAEGEQIDSAMLAELERHADTAELAGALRGQDLGLAAREAGQLARRLRTAGLSLEARKRMQRAFHGGLEAASARDLQTLLGRHLSRAHDELAQGHPESSAEEFEALAARYQQMLERENVMDTLQRLAENLRTSGQRALGGNQGRMRRIQAQDASRMPPSGLSQVGTQPVQLAQGPRPPRSGAERGDATPRQPAPSGAPVPGSEPQRPSACPGCEKCRAAKAARQGSSAGQGSKTPVPGTQSRGSPSGGT